MLLTGNVLIVERDSRSIEGAVKGILKGGLERIVDANIKEQLLVFEKEILKCKGCSVRI